MRRQLTVVARRCLVDGDDRNSSNTNHHGDAGGAVGTHLMTGEAPAGAVGTDAANLLAQLEQNHSMSRRQDDDDEDPSPAANPAAPDWARRLERRVSDEDWGWVCEAIGCNSAGRNFGKSGDSSHSDLGGRVSAVWSE